MSKEGWAWGKNLGHKKHYYKCRKAVCGITIKRGGMLRAHKQVLESTKCRNCSRVLGREKKLERKKHE